VRYSGRFSPDAKTISGPPVVNSKISPPVSRMVSATKRLPAASKRFSLVNDIRLNGLPVRSARNGCVITYALSLPMTDENSGALRCLLSVAEERADFILTH